MIILDYDKDALRIVAIISSVWIKNLRIQCFLSAGARFFWDTIYLKYHALDSQLWKE